MMSNFKENRYQIKFSIKYQTVPGQSMYIFGGAKELGNWKESNLKLKWSEGHIWKAKLEVPQSVTTFPFKFVCISDDNKYRRWEEGPDRIFDKTKFENQETIKVDCMWEHFCMSFNIYYPLNNETEYLQIIGGPKELGNWFREGGQPVKMTLTEAKTLNDSALWEREPNRKIKILTDLNNVPNGVSDVLEQVGREVELLTNSDIVHLDVNFVTHLKFDKIGDHKIYIGPYPQNDEDIQILAFNNITAVLNVQTDMDMTHRQVNWLSNMDSYKRNHIEIVRIPIRDFDQKDLITRLKVASDNLKELLDQGKVVYVHCTAGMSRAAATVIAYLIFYESYTLKEAYEYVKTHRDIICPNMNAIAEVIRNNEEIRSI